MSHYFINDSTLEHQNIIIKTVVLKTELVFRADAGVFSKSALDFGTRVLLETINLQKNLSILDVGCGYGPIGIYLGLNFSPRQIIMIDVNQRALTLASQNLELNKVSATLVESSFFEKINGTFDVIVSNPPIRVGKKILYQFYEDAIKHLNKDGTLWLVVGKKQGAESTVTYLKSFYSTVETVRKYKGFFIIKAVK